MLGLLALEPLTGYELTGRMKERVGYFWGARHSQIYPELAKLEGRGFVSQHPVEQSGRPDKKVHTITDAGLAAVREWAVAPAKPRPNRDEVVLKAGSLWTVDPLEAAILYRDEEHRHQEQLAEYEQIRDWMHEQWAEKLQDPSSPEFATYATLRRGLGYEREYADWCGWLAERLEESES